MPNLHYTPAAARTLARLEKGRHADPCRLRRVRRALDRLAAWRLPVPGQWSGGGQPGQPTRAPLRGGPPGGPGSGVTSSSGRSENQRVFGLSGPSTRIG
ncbi:hypothetical protein P3T27_006845 [Kitasatospora sp. MAA19]|nr:hypothetical protein [Kitasatospora sp. MAA19]